jgi:hypothetical protein
MAEDGEKLTIKTGIIQLYERNQTGSAWSWKIKS